MKKRIFIQQQDQSDCGVACLAMAIRYFGGDVLLERLRELSGTTQSGTTLLGLFQAARELGLKAGAYEAEISHLKTLQGLSILHVIIDQRLQHFVLCLGYDAKQDCFEIKDPAVGTRQLSSSELSDIWQSKALLWLEGITEAFQIRPSRKRAQWTWLQEMIRPDQDILIVAFFLGLILSVLGLSLAIFSQILLDDILPTQDSPRFWGGMALLMLLLLFKGALGYLRQYFLLRQSKDFNIRMLDQFFGALMYLPKAFFDNRKTGDLIARMNDTSRIQTTVSYLAAQVMIEALVVLLSVGAIFYYSTLVGLIALCLFPIYCLITWRFHQPLEGAQREAMAAYAKNESHYVDAIQGIGAIKIQGKEAIYAHLTHHIYTYLQQSLLRLGKVNLRFGLMVEWTSSLFVWVLLGGSGGLVLAGQLTIGVMMAMLQLASMLMNASSQLALSYIRIQEARVAFDRMYEFTSIQPEHMPVHDAPPTQANPPAFQNLSIHGLTFRYPGRKALLQKIDLHIQKGELVALLGESGGGKSTLLQILQRFYSPEEGQILYNEKDIQSFALPVYRSMLGVVPQQVKIFNGTLLDNILMGEISEELAQGKMDPGLLRLQNWGLDRYFHAFPQGYATLLGEEGINISGGQQQLVGWARALYKNPQLLLLDEPTAAMDRHTEQFVMDLLDKIKTEKGALILTHRLSTARRADRIFILKDGHIQAQGTHQSLIQAADNLYALSYQDVL